MKKLLFSLLFCVAVLTSGAATTNTMATRPWVLSLFTNSNARVFSENLIDGGTNHLSGTNTLNFLMYPTNKIYTKMVTTFVGYNTNSSASTNEIWISIGGTNGTAKFPVVYNQMLATNITNRIEFGYFLTGVGSYSIVAPFVHYANQSYNATNFNFVKLYPVTLNFNIFSNTVVTNQLIWTNYGSDGFLIIYRDTEAR